MNKTFIKLKENWVLWLILIISLVVRYAKLDFQSLWLDEIYTMNMANPANGISEIYALSQTTDALSVLYFVLLNFIFKTLAYTSFVARMFSLIFGVLGIYCTFLLGKEIRNKNTGLFAALILSVNYFHIFYSQEARVYSMYMAFTCLSFLFLLKFLKSSTTRHAVYYGLGTLLMLWSHFFGLFVVVSQVAIIIFWTLYFKSNIKTLFKKGIITFLIVVIGFLPELPILFSLSKVSSTWIAPLTNRAFADMFSAFFGDSFLLISLAIVFLLFILFKTFDEHPMERSVENKQDLTMFMFVLLPWIFVCFFIPYFKSFLQFPIFQSRYLISILPAIVLLIAAGFDMVKSKLLGQALLIFFVLLSFSEVWIVKHYYKNKVKSDFRGVSEFVCNNNSNHLKVLTTLPYHFGYYFKLFNATTVLEELTVEKNVLQMIDGNSKKTGFWALDAHGRKFELSEQARNYLYKNFDEVYSLESFDAWAKCFFPKAVADTSALFKIKIKDFSQENLHVLNNNIYLYSNGFVTSNAFDLGFGKYQLVIKGFSTPSFSKKEDNAHLNVFVNGFKTGSFYFSKQSPTLGDTIKFELDSTQLVRFKLEFDNDISTKEYDRNLEIRELLLFKK